MSIRSVRYSRVFVVIKLVTGGTSATTDYATRFIESIFLGDMLGDRSIYKLNCNHISALCTHDEI